MKSLNGGANGSEVDVGPDIKRGRTGPQRGALPHPIGTKELRSGKGLRGFAGVIHMDA